MDRLRLFGGLKPAGALDEWDAPSQGGGGYEFPAIRPTRNASPSYLYPSSGGAVVITAPDDASWSTETVLEASTPAACILSTLNVHCSHGIAGPEARSIFIRLSVGPEGSEVPIGTWYDKCTAIATHSYGRQFRLNGKLVASGSRLTAAIRLDSASGGTNRHQMAIAICAPPSPVLFTDDWDEDTYMQGGVDEEGLTPAAPDFTNVPCGAADAWGSPVELIPSASGRLLIFGVNVKTAGTPPPPYPTRLAIQVGIGASGSETWHEATQLISALSSAPSGTAELPRPVEVMIGHRVVARTQTNKASHAVHLGLVTHLLNF